MADISLRSEDLEDLARDMKSWKERISSLNSRLKSQISTMSGWKDPQHAMFLNAVSMTHKQLEFSAKNLEMMANNLHMYAQQQQEMNRQFAAQLNR